MKKIAILGGGSWGTALALALTRSRARHRLSLWVHDPQVCAVLRDTRVNETYLPGYALPAGVEVTSGIRTALAGAEIVVSALPSAHVRQAYSSAIPFLSPDMIFVSATKGLERETDARMSEVISRTLAGSFAPKIAVLSGPSFAREVARGDPTAVVIASSDRAVSAAVQEEFSGPAFRLYTNADVPGVELAGAMKNVIAIAAGACEGLGLGFNSLAALITRGLAEMSRLAVALGARPETLSGLAGLGDLVLTCTGSLSRNRGVGLELGKGRKLDDILAGTRMIAEGVGTAAAVLDLARKAAVDMPISEQICALLYKGKSPRDAIRDIMDRPLKQESPH